MIDRIKICLRNFFIEHALMSQDCKIDEVVIPKIKKATNLALEKIHISRYTLVVRKKEGATTPSW